MASDKTKARTLYVRPEDQAIWVAAERAAKASGQSLSQLVATAVQRHLASGKRAKSPERVASVLRQEAERVAALLNAAADQIEGMERP